MCSVCVLSQPGKDCKERMCKACCVKHALAHNTTCETHGKSIRKAIAGGGSGCENGEHQNGVQKQGVASEVEPMGADHREMDAQAVAVP